MAPSTRSKRASGTSTVDASTAENKSSGRLSSKKRASSATPLVECKKQKTLDSFFGGVKTKKTNVNNDNVAAAAPKTKSNNRKKAVPAAKMVSFSSSDTTAAETSGENSNSSNTNAPKYRYMKTPYTAGDHLPVITEPQLMFDDMVERLRTTSTNEKNRLASLVQKLRHRPLRIATMCSGTESPLLALDMLQKSIRDACRDHPELLGSPTTDECGGEDETATIFQLEHAFSCEIEPFKQAYIERNFHPPLLFRDIRELGQDQAYTAYGALHPVPHDNIDVLVAGTSCVDYSNLNNAKKEMEQQGESGSTFFGMMNWIRKASPLIVIIENVFGAPWDKKVELFAKLGYSADYLKLDTKDFYIPHTRQRGYLFAIKQQSTGKGKKLDSRPQDWKSLVGQLKRPASASVDAFVLRDDDPRVLRGRARLTAESSLGENGTRAGRTDWTKCETRHLAARSMEELGDQRPLTGWSDSGRTALPGHCWNEWANAQVNRIHDLLDINTLRLATDGVDALWKTMIWNLSQNVDRDTMGRLGLCQCLTPTGVPYLTSRGGPLCGEELLMLQGIPADDLLLTKESEDNLKDLAGNAMSTTVVGASMLAALLVGHASLLDDDDDDEDSRSCSISNIVPSLVPRALVPVSKEISVSSEFGTYEHSVVDLFARELPDDSAWMAFLAAAASSSRKCVSEGVEECIPLERLVQCQACGQTSSVANAFPPRKFCEHDYAPMASGCRVEPSAFREKLFQVLPMRIVTDGFDADELEAPKDADPSLWKKWIAAFRRTVTNEDSGTASEFLLEEVKRTHIWTAFYRGSSGGRLEARVSDRGVTWFLFANAPNKTGALKTRLENPIARMAVSPSSSGSISLLAGSWEYCLPAMSAITVSIEGVGGLIPSWYSRLGLKGSFESERQYEALQIQINDPNHGALQEIINGTYKLLPKCGGACGSLLVKTCETSDSPSEDNELFFFLDSGLKTLPKDDAFVFAPSFHRTARGEFREIVLQIDPEAQYRPVVRTDSHNGSGTAEVQAILPGLWLTAPNASLKPLSDSKCSEMIIKCPVTPLAVPIHRDAWKVCPELISCTVKVAPAEDLFVRCHKAGGTVELNLQKSQKTLAYLAFALSRLEIPALFRDDRWLDLDQTRFAVSDGDAVCRKCAPKPPQVRWTLVAKGNKAKFIPIEDGKEAAVFERALKERPEPWIVRINTSNGDMPSFSLTIGCNAVSLVQRAFGLLPANTVVRQRMVSLAETIVSDRKPSCLCEFGWRVVSHVEMVAADFPKLTFSSNRHDPESEQPPNFLKYKLRKEQLRSLTWMKELEASTEPFYEEEIMESVLPKLNWRIEGRVRRPVLVRGGIIADEVGYGKTACALALIDSSKPLENWDPQNHRLDSLLPTKATLVVVPKHLMGQWPEEVKKFLGTSKAVIVIKDMSSLNKISVDNVQNADIVIVSFAVLSNDQYFSRLARLTHINARCLSGANGGRHFNAVYNEMLCELPTRVTEIIKDCKSAHEAIEKAASSHKKQNATGTLRLDGKKAVYKMGVSASQVVYASSETKLTPAEIDPWKLSSAKKYNVMKSPPLEMFSWNRLVVDEFTYLVSKKDRERCLAVVKELKSNFRWLLSGTPKHSNFNDISSLACLLGVHLGVEEDLPGTKISNKYLNDKESTGLESLSSFLESRSMQWHIRRHAKAQAFLDRFIRQNIAELDEIPYDDQKCPVVLPPAERAIYLELEAHLKSLEMNSKSAQKSKSKSTGDRESRMQKILHNSETGEEALLKCCSHFNMSSGSRTALETVDSIISLRASEKEKCEQEMVSMLTAALRQRQRILDCHPDWLSVTATEKGEVRDALGVYLGQVEANASVTHGADEEVNNRVNELVQEAVDCFQAAPGTDVCDPFFSNEDEGSECDMEATRKKQKRQKKEPTREVDAIRLFAMKQALRNHMHVVRSISKELCGRYRSLRYIQQIRRYQQKAIGFECVACKSSHLPVQDVGVLSCCGHAGCEKDLLSAAAEGRCIDPLCTARVSVSHVLSAKNFGDLKEETVLTGQFGRKLSALAGTVHDLVDNQGDRVVVFCQFDDLSEKVKDALTSSGIKSVQVKGTVTQQISTISVFQKEKPAKGDPRVLLLKMDDEQSAGLNLTNLNHAIFVHPLLADTQVEYDAYETQAIGRLRRYGQKKTVYVWRFLAEDTIDTQIYLQRSFCHTPTTSLFGKQGMAQ